MKRATKLFAVITAAVMLMAGTATAASTNVNVTINNILTPIEESGQSGRVGWENGIVEAVGTGFAPTNARSIAQGTALARRAAILDAQRNLLEAIQGVQVDSETTIRNLEITSDVVQTKVSGLLKGAKIVRQQAMPDGSYQVVMSINLYGNDSLASIALNAVKNEQPVEEFPAPAPSYVPPVTHNDTASLYTGVIIDARGLGLESTFSPRVYDESNTIVYGNKYIDVNYAISQGMVDYAITPEMVQAAENGQSRAGSHPLVIKALRVVDNDCNVVISTEDANAMLAYNQNAGFLKKCAVVFER